MIDPLTRILKHTFGVPAHIKDFTITVANDQRPRVSFAGSIIIAAEGTNADKLGATETSMTSYDMVRTTPERKG